MKILLDHNLDRRLKNYLADHETATTFECGWSDVTNGELISLAEERGFDVLSTADANIKQQQNLVGRKISIIILRAFDNRLSTHLEMLEELRSELHRIEAGVVVELRHRNMDH